MNRLSVEDAWIKAAIEHVTLRIVYYSGKTKRQLTTREVEPDFIGLSKDGKNNGCWGFCRLRKGNRVFEPQHIQSWEHVGTPFTPNSEGRWRELLSKYNAKKLSEISW